MNDELSDAHYDYPSEWEEQLYGPFSKPTYIRGHVLPLFIETFDGLVLEYGHLGL